jgi:hypothetical protein
MKSIIFSLIFSIFTSAVLAQGFDYRGDNTSSNKLALRDLKNIGGKNIGENDFYFKPFISIEYSAPEISGGGGNTAFKASQGLFEQIKDFENIAIGGNFRVQKYLGFNANFAQTTMDHNNLSGVGALSRKANLKIDHYNFSALFYMPVRRNVFEFFFEGGISDISSRLTYADISGNSFSGKTRDTKSFYGGGASFYLGKDDAIRLSAQKYSGKLALIGSNFTTVRIGYLKAF